jgi:ribonuclease P protein component
VLATKNRFRGSRAIARVYKTGGNTRARGLGLRLRQTGESDFRAAVVVSKKVHKSAVVRNRIRRRIYETLRTDNRQRLGGTEVVLSVFDVSFATMSAERLRAEVASLLSKAQRNTPPKAAREVERAR